MHTLTTIEKTWFIAHTSGDVGAWGVLEAGQTLETGQHELETFTSEIAWIARQIELGIPHEELM